jgi:hypothetical protein
MKKGMFSLFFMTIMLLSCHKSIEFSTDCVKDFIKKNDLKTGNMAENCGSIFTLYELDGLQYIALGNNCPNVNSLPTVVDCARKPYCTGNCVDFFKKADKKGIIGYIPFK